MAKARYVPAKPVETVPSNQSNNRTTPDQTEIAAAAYCLWQERGCPIGSDHEDWFRAEGLTTRNKGPSSEVQQDHSLESGLNRIPKVEKWRRENRHAQS